MENENKKAASLDIKRNDIYNKLKNIKPNGVPNELRIPFFFYLWLACYSGRALSNSIELIIWTCLLLFVENFPFKFFFFYFIYSPWNHQKTYGFQMISRDMEAYSLKFG